MHWYQNAGVKMLEFGETWGNRRLFAVKMGHGDRRVMLSACHHANEWLTGLCLWGALEAYAHSAEVCEDWAVSAMEETTVLAVPWVNPDGASLLLGLAQKGEWEQTAKIAEAYPQIPFPGGWKANLRGTDLNVNYPANWGKARENKGRLGIMGPAPRDFVGPYPLSEPESTALVRLTEDFCPDSMVALHSQGQEIYANYGKILPPGGKTLAEKISKAVGYPVITTPTEADCAGYKDWYIQEYLRPGVTIELGLGENPLPLCQFPELLEKTKAILRAVLE